MRLEVIFVFLRFEMGSEVKSEASADSPTSVLEDEVLFFLAFFCLRFFSYLTLEKKCFCFFFLKKLIDFIFIFIFCKLQEEKNCRSKKKLFFLF